jgi:hypothetical protein
MADLTTAAAFAVKHIRFTREPADQETVLRRFTQPRQITAVEKPSELGKVPMDRSWPEPFDDLFAIVAPTSLPQDLREKVDLWLSPPDHPDAPQPVTLRLKSGTIRWRPSRAVVEYNAGSESLLAALTTFAFFEGELRRLEQDLLPYEASAPGDTALAYRIRSNGRAAFERLGRTMENLSILRLKFARLEPVLSTPPRSLDREGRRAAAGLAARSGVRARLESFSNRLEACEDLYEGAVDRITDFHWYRKGEFLETTIIVLLVVEVILMAFQHS